MTNLKYTPSPWRVVHNSWDISTVYGSDDIVVALIPIGDLTCDEDQERFETVKEVNAQLIAVAPELLEALKLTRRELHACQAVIHLHGGFDPAYVNDAQKALKIIDAAIAKATGEQA